MNYAKKLEELPMIYSCCSGYNFYFPANRRSCEVFGERKNIIQHVKTEEFFYVTEFPDDMNNDVDLNYWIEIIRKPVDLKHYVWPVDVIIWDEQPKGKKRYALVFPIRALPAFEPVSTLLSNDMQAGWNMTWVKKIVPNLLEAWCHFDDSKYAYHEFSDQNMFYQKETYDVMFDFSFSTQRVDGLFRTCRVNKKRVMPDYADSYYYTDGRNYLMDLASDYYSIAVILFKILVGRLPYQGKVMEHEPNSNELEHNSWIRVYHKNTFFIFDEKDDTNQIGGETGFAKDDIFVERWEELPLHIRNMFHNVFQTANVMRLDNELIFYSPHEWKEALLGNENAVTLLYRNVEQQSIFSAQETKKQEAELGDAEPLYIENNIEASSDPELLMLNGTELSNSTVTENKKETLGKFVDILKSNTTAMKFHDVILTKSPKSEKILAIKVIREITGLGLASAKELVENPPTPLVQGITEDLALKIQAELLLVNIESELSKNTKHNSQTESEIVSRMQGRWQSNT